MRNLKTGFFGLRKVLNSCERMAIDIGSLIVQLTSSLKRSDI